MANSLCPMRWWTLRPWFLVGAIAIALLFASLVLLVCFPSLQTPIRAAPAWLALSAALKRDGCDYDFRWRQHPEPTGCYSLVVRSGTISPETAKRMVAMGDLRQINFHCDRSPLAEEALRGAFWLHGEVAGRKPKE